MKIAKLTVLTIGEEMDSWISPKGNLVFIGDACHPMLPYLAQGANSALEDGAVLGKVLKDVERSSVYQALVVFEKLRKQRGEAIVKETFKQASEKFRDASQFADDVSETGLSYARWSRAASPR